ncbi:MAG: hypothetical protein OXI71_16800 [Gemmatimonadota bacterium]|nr:hypothetical protein [Gemmatimonadota bacterium]
MGDQSDEELERLRETGERAFGALFDEDFAEGPEKALGTDPDSAVETGTDWGYAVGCDAGAVLVFWSAIKWEFKRRIADAFSTLLARTLDPGCVPDVMAAGGCSTRCAASFMSGSARG